MRKKLCAGSGQRPAKFRVRRGRLKSDHTHTLCSRCWGAEVDRSWARSRAREQIG